MIAGRSVYGRQRSDSARPLLLHWLERERSDIPSSKEASLGCGSVIVPSVPAWSSNATVGPLQALRDYCPEVSCPPRGLATPETREAPDSDVRNWANEFHVRKEDIIFFHSLSWFSSQGCTSLLRMTTIVSMVPNMAVSPARRVLCPFLYPLSCRSFSSTRTLHRSLRARKPRMEEGVARTVQQDISHMPASTIPHDFGLFESTLSGLDPLMNTD